MKITLFLLFFILFSSLYAVDTVTLKSGDILTGQIVTIDDNIIVIERNGNNLSLSKSLIERYSFGKEKDEESFASFGFTLGFPGGINLTTAYNSKNFATRVSAGIIPSETGGIYGLFGYPIYDSPDLYIVPSFVLGLSVGIYEEKKVFNYLGGGVDINIYGFTSFIGLGYGIDRINQKGFIFDIGYKYAWH